MENKELQGKVILITGAGKGIGRIFALELLKSGASVGACSRNTNDLLRLAEEAKRFSGNLLTSCFDVRDFEATQKFVEEIEGNFKRLDFAIINAGITTENATIENSDLAKWSETIEVNLIGSLKTAKAVIPLLKKSKQGSIIFIGSGLGHRGLPGTSSYSSSKAGVSMLTRILAQELIDSNILVNELIPGPVNTEIDRGIVERHSSGSFSNEWKKEPEDIIPLLKYMLSFPVKGPTGQTFSLTRREI